MFEIWRNKASGARYLVHVRDGKVFATVGPLEAHEDPQQALEQYVYRRQNAWAMFDMRHRPSAYQRECSADQRGRFTVVAEQDAHAP